MGNKEKFITKLRKMLNTNSDNWYWTDDTIFFIKTKNNKWLQDGLQTFFNHQFVWVFTRQLTQHNFYVLYTPDGFSCSNPNFKKDGSCDYLIKFNENGKSNNGKKEEDENVSLMELAETAESANLLETNDLIKERNDLKLKLKEKEIDNLLKERNKLRKKVEEKENALKNEIEELKKKLKSLS